MKSMLIAVAVMVGTAGTAAVAQDATTYPPCTSTVMDKCMDTGKMHKPMMKRHKAMKHRSKMAKKTAAMAPADAAPGTAPSN